MKFIKVDAHTIDLSKVLHYWEYISKQFGQMKTGVRFEFGDNCHLDIEAVTKLEVDAIVFAEENKLKEDVKLLNEMVDFRDKAISSLESELEAYKTQNSEVLNDHVRLVQENACLERDVSELKEELVKSERAADAEIERLRKEVPKKVYGSHATDEARAKGCSCPPLTGSGHFDGVSYYCPLHGR